MIPIHRRAELAVRLAKLDAERRADVFYNLLDDRAELRRCLEACVRRLGPDSWEAGQAKQVLERSA